MQQLGRSAHRCAHPICPCEDIRHEGLFLELTGRKLHSKSRRESNQWPEEQLVVGKDHGQHRSDGREYRVDALFLDGGSASSLYVPVLRQGGNLLPLGPMLAVFEKPGSRP